MRQPHQPRLRFLHLLGQEQRRQHRRQRERQDERAEQREDQRQRHRLEQFSLDAFQRENRQEHNHDDAHAERHGPRHFQRRAAQHFLALIFGQHASQFMLPHRQPPHGVFHHHHRAIHDEAEVHRAQTQQAGGDARLQHEVAREEHRKRNRHRHNQSGPQVAQEGKQDGDDQQRPGQQVVFDRANHVVHQFRPVVEHFQLHVRRQELLHLGQLGLERVRHHRAVLAHQHEAQPQHRFAPAIRRHRAAADFVILLHRRHVPHPHRRSVMAGDDDVGDFLDVGGQADAVNQQRFAAAHNLAAAHVLVVRLQRLDQFLERQPVFDEPVGFHHHMELLLESAPGVHLGHARHLAQLRLHHPVLQRRATPSACGWCRWTAPRNGTPRPSPWRWGQAAGAPGPPATPRSAAAP